MDSRALRGAGSVYGLVRNSPALILKSPAAWANSVGHLPSNRPLLRGIPAGAGHRGNCSRTARWVLPLGATFGETGEEIAAAAVSRSDAGEDDSVTPTPTLTPEIDDEGTVIPRAVPVPEP